MDDNLQPKNDYFAKREEKEKAAKEEKNKKMLKNGMRWLGFIVVAGLFIWWVYGYFKTASVDGEVPGEYFQAQSRDHIPKSAEHPAYNSNPPTGGWHYDQPAQTGIYDVEIPDEQLIHNLEHSHVWIAHKPDLSAEEKEKLADLAKDYGSKIIMTPRAANDASIVFVAWGYLLKMEVYDEVAAREFIEAYRGLAGPEKIADFGFKDFRSSGEAPKSGGQMQQ